MHSTHKIPLKLLIYTLITSILLTACTPKNPIIGTWSQINGNQTWEFHQGGTFTLTEPGTALTGVYQLMDDNQLLITFNQYDALIAPQTFTYTIEADRLVLSSKLYGQLEYQRGKSPSS